ncbi:MAG: restriction endonuclease subunit S, partial [Blastocatellales bacterium]
ITLMNIRFTGLFHARSSFCSSDNAYFACQFIRYELFAKSSSYLQTKPKALEKRFKVRELGEAGEVLKGVTVPYYEDGSIPIIRSGDLSDISDGDRFLRSKPIERIFYLDRGDVLISSIGFGSIGKVQVFDQPGQFGTVSEVSVVRQQELNPYYLTFFLRSSIGQMQIERFITGATGQLHLYPRDVARVFVPVLPQTVQSKFQQLAESAHTARREARELLERAKRAVEIAIEQNEAAALSYLNHHYSGRRIEK